MGANVEGKGRRTGGVLVGAAAVGALWGGEDKRIWRVALGSSLVRETIQRNDNKRARLSFNNETLKKLALVLHMALGTSFVPEISMSSRALLSLPATSGRLEVATAGLLAFPAV